MDKERIKLIKDIVEKKVVSQLVPKKDFVSKGVKVVTYTLKSNDRTGTQSKTIKLLEKLVKEDENFCDLTPRIKSKTSLSMDDSEVKAYGLTVRFAYKPLRSAAINTEMLESAQCLFCAIWQHTKKEDITLSDFEEYGDLIGKTAIVRASLKEMLKVLDEEWTHSSNQTRKLITSKITGTSKKFEFHRDGKMVDMITKKVFKHLNDKEKKAEYGVTFGRKDKWNPADIWVTSDSNLVISLLNEFLKDREPTFKGKTYIPRMAGLNELMLDLIANDVLYPVSLKKVVTTGQVTKQNFGDKSPLKFSGKIQFRQIVEGNLANTGIVVPGYHNPTKPMNLRAFTTTSWSGELIGEGSRAGKVGLDNINQYFRKYGLNTKYYLPKYSSIPANPDDMMFQILADEIDGNITIDSNKLARCRNRRSLYTALLFLRGVKMLGNKQEKFMTDIGKFAAAVGENNGPYYLVSQ